MGTEVLYEETQRGFLLLTLTTIITADGIKITLSPFSYSRKIPVSEVAEVRVGTYQATKFGGWGWGIRIFGDHTAYRLSGNSGVYVELRSGEEVFIGSETPSELAGHLEALFHND